jgi:hypothetical protein
MHAKGCTFFFGGKRVDPGNLVPRFPQSDSATFPHVFFVFLSCDELPGCAVGIGCFGRGVWSWGVWCELDHAGALLYCRRGEIAV